MLRVSQLQGQRQPPSRLQLTTPPSKPRLLRFCPASAALVAPSSVFAGPGVCNRRLPCTISGITCEDPYSSPQSIVHGGFGTLPHVWSGTLVGVSVATLQYNSVEIAKSSSYEHTERLRVMRDHALSLNLPGMRFSRFGSLASTLEPASQRRGRDASSSCLSRQLRNARRGVTRAEQRRDWGTRYETFKYETAQA